MKKIIVFLVIVHFISCKQKQAVINSNYKGPLKIELKSGELYINEYKVRSFNLAEIKDVLGGDYRVVEKYNTIFIYDESGVQLYRTGKSKKANEIEIYFNAHDWVPDYDDSSNPRKTFNGTFSIERLEIHSSDNMNEIRSKLNGYNFDFGNKMCRGQKNGIYVYLHALQSSDKIYYISFGLN